MRGSDRGGEGEREGGKKEWGSRRIGSEGRMERKRDR